jgi:DNA-binding MarR family transcriptional regulator
MLSAFSVQALIDKELAATRAAAGIEEHATGTIRQRILTFLKDHPRQTARRIAQILDVKSTTTASILLKMHMNDEVIRDPPPNDFGGYFYSINPAARTGRSDK